MKTSKYLLLLLLFFTLNLEIVKGESDSLKVYLKESKNRFMAVDLTFENISSDTIILRSCFDVFNGKETYSGFNVELHIDSVTYGIPFGDEPVTLKYENCRTKIPPKSQVGYRIPLAFYLKHYEKKKTIGVIFYVNYIFIQDNKPFSRKIKTNYLELWNNE